jgi:predicted dehydrogenase
MVRRALEAKKHVLVEKPITNSLEDAFELCRLAESVDRVLMVGHVFLFNPAIRAAKGYIDAGDLGQVEYLSMTRTNLGPVRTDVNAAWDLASHDISIANYWLGTIPDTVSASGGSWLNQGVQDVVFATLRYPNGVVVHIEASWLNPRKRRLISVIGAERMLTVDDMDINEPLRLYDKGVVGAEAEITDTFAGFRSQIREGQVLIPHVTTGEPLRAECDSFLARIRGGEESLSDGWAGADVVAVLEAIDRSMANDGAQQAVERVR